MAVLVFASGEEPPPPFSPRPLSQVFIQCQTFPSSQLYMKMKAFELFNYIKVYLYSMTLLLPGTRRLDSHLAIGCRN